MQIGAYEKYSVNIRFLSLWPSKIFEPTKTEQVPIYYQNPLSGFLSLKGFLKILFFSKTVNRAIKISKVEERDPKMRFALHMKSRIWGGAKETAQPTLSIKPLME